METLDDFICRLFYFLIGRQRHSQHVRKITKCSHPACCYYNKCNSINLNRSHVPIDKLILKDRQMDNIKCQIRSISCALTFQNGNKTEEPQKHTHNDVLKCSTKAYITAHVISINIFSICSVYYLKSFCVDPYVV